MTWRSIRRFLGLTLALSWGVVGLALAAVHGLHAEGWLVTMALTLAACAPGIAALVVAPGRRALLTLSLPRPVTLAWLAAGPATIALIAWLLPGEPRGAATIGLLAWVAPIGEEVGWRGFLLPALARRMSVAGASAAVGLVWIVWHLPGWLVPGVLAGTDPLAWATGTMALSLAMGWLYARSNGNLLAAGILPHAAVDLVGGWTYAWPQTAALVAIAAALLAFDRSWRAGPVAVPTR